MRSDCGTFRRDPLSHVIDSSGTSGPAPGSTQHVPRLVLGRAGTPRCSRSGRTGRGTHDGSGAWRASGPTPTILYSTRIRRRFPRLAPHDRFQSAFGSSERVGVRSGRDRRVRRTTPWDRLHFVPRPPPDRGQQFLCARATPYRRGRVHKKKRRTRSENAAPDDDTVALVGRFAGGSMEGV